MDVKEKGMQKKLLLAAVAAIAAVAVSALVLMLGRREESYRSIKIIELGGGVTIEREGVGTLAASSNMNLISGDAVKTEQDAYAVLQLDSDKYVMLAESGSMTVVAEGDEANGRTAIQLDSGSVLSEIQNPLSDGSSYDIVTPNATMSVRGTVFEVRRSGAGNTGDIEVLVFDGKVAVGLGDQEPALYGAGEYTQFTADENPQFVVERAEIAEENLNPQFMERLEQINSQSRELNLGTAQLASARTQEEAAGDQLVSADKEPAAEEPSAPSAQTPAAAPEATTAAASGPVTAARPGTDGTVPGVTASVESPADNGGDQKDEDQPDDPESGQQPGEDSGNSGNEENPGDSGNEGASGDSGNGGSEGAPGGSGNEGSEGAPGDSGNGGNEGTPGDSGNEGSEGTPGNNGNGGNGGTPGGSGNGGNEGTPGGSGNGGTPGGSGNEGTPGNSGNGGSEGTPGDSGNGGTPGDSGSTGDGGNEGKPGDDGQGGGSGNIDDKQNYWQKYTWADYKQAVSDGLPEGAECTVIYYVPYVAVTEDKDGGRYSTLAAIPPVCTSAQVPVGGKLTEPAKPETPAGAEGKPLIFGGWCLEDGTVWDFEKDTVEADTCLYPLWIDGIKTCYVPVICRSEPWCYYCNSVEAGSFLRETSLSVSGNPSFQGWENVLNGGMWDLDNDTVTAVTSLRASWSNGAGD